MSGWLPWRGRLEGVSSSSRRSCCWGAPPDRLPLAGLLLVRNLLLDFLGGGLGGGGVSRFVFFFLVLSVLVLELSGVPASPPLLFLAVWLPSLPRRSLSPASRTVELLDELVSDSRTGVRPWRPSAASGMLPVRLLDMVTGGLLMPTADVLVLVGEAWRILLLLLLPVAATDDADDADDGAVPALPVAPPGEESSVGAAASMPMDPVLPELLWPLVQPP